MPLHSTKINDVDRYELAAILAGLRLLQQTPDLLLEIEEIVTDCNEFTPLDGAQIDVLCVRINAVSEYPWRDVTEDDAETVALKARVDGLFIDFDDVAEDERAGAAIDMQMSDRTYFEGGV